MDAQPGANDSPMEQPTCWEVEKMPIQSKVNSMSRAFLCLLVIAMLASYALAQGQATRDRARPFE